MKRVRDVEETLQQYQEDYCTKIHISQLLEGFTNQIKSVRLSHNDFLSLYDDNWHYLGEWKGLDRVDECDPTNRFIVPTNPSNRNEIT